MSLQDIIIKAIRCYPSLYPNRMSVLMSIFSRGGSFYIDENGDVGVDDQHWEEHTPDVAEGLRDEFNNLKLKFISDNAERFADSEESGYIEYINVPEIPYLEDTMSQAPLALLSDETREALLDLLIWIPIQVNSKSSASEQRRDNYAMSPLSHAPSPALGVILGKVKMLRGELKRPTITEVVASEDEAAQMREIVRRFQTEIDAAFPRRNMRLIAEPTGDV